MSAASTSTLAEQTREILTRLGVPDPLSGRALGSDWSLPGGPRREVSSPIDGSRLAELPEATAADVDEAVVRATSAFRTWRSTPAPVRGGLVRELGELLRAHKEDLAWLVTVDCGKIYQEGLGEVQEMIDICDFAVGLSRQLYGLSIASERPGHRLAEQWHPLGPIGVISAFNFPVAVWAWNTMLALVCGDPVVWKPSEKTPLTALACHAIGQAAIASVNAPPDLLQLVIGGRALGEAIAAHPGLPLISATGSVPMGRAVAQTVAGRLGRSLLELGGNNAAIVAPSADLELAIRAVIFSAVGTCGQRCTSLRRLIVHESIRDAFLSRLLEAYRQVRIGDPLSAGTLVGPLIDGDALQKMQNALERARREGGIVHGGEPFTEGVPAGGYYVHPALVEIEPNATVVAEETFAPLTYLMSYSDFEQAIELQNSVPQGLSSCLFTTDVREAERFCSATGSDCGIANVNIGTSGAEIGGAFGGEKETGGGRESGSDAWRNYMRRATNTINYSTELPLAQGIRFDLD